MKEAELLPISIVLVDTMQNTTVPKKPLLVLFDSGSTGSWMNAKSLPKGINGKSVTPVQGSTLAGNFKSSREVNLTHLVFPEFSKHKALDKATMRVFDSHCRYDMIIGRDVLRTLGLNLDFQDNIMTWDGQSVSMKPYPQMKLNDPEDELSPAYILLYDIIEEDLEDSYDNYVSDDRRVADDDEFQKLHHEIALEKEEGNPSTQGYKSKTIAASTYDDVDMAEVARRQTHLSQQQRNELQELLSEFPTLFNGKLKAYPHEKVHLDIDPNVKPKQIRPYALAKMHEKVFKDELDRLVKIGVLEPAGRSEWISGTFIRPKKDGKVRWLSDFRALNSAIKRKVYHLPRISDILSKRKGYAFFSKLDVSMCYYTFEMDDASKEACTIATPFGLYRYCRLPMGVSCSPDICQEIMERILRELDVDVYIDDIACFSDDWSSHCTLLRKVLKKLQDNGFTINPLKCEWGVKETDFLGHWMTPHGIKPWQKKVDAILKMRKPTNLKELRSFIGMVNYYRDMWPKRAETLAPLTALTGKKKLEWNPMCDIAFEQMKAMVAQDALLAYPDHNKPFEIYTDASDYQLGAVLKQEGRPVAFYSRKLNSAQKNYSTIEKELLSVVETFREFRTMLLGARITVYTDHKNLSYKLTEYTTQRVARWRLLLEEFGPTFKYIKGPDNVLADALSRVPTSRTERESLDGISSSSSTIKFEEDPQDQDQGAQKKNVDDVDAESTTGTNEQLLSEDSELAECLLVHPRFDERGRLPFHFATIRHYQQNDQSLVDKVARLPQRFAYKTLGGLQIIHVQREGKDGLKWRIALPDAMLPKLVTWYHKVTSHALGMSRLEESLKLHFYNPKIHEEVHKQVKSCVECNKYKFDGRQYGELAPRDAIAMPWYDVHIDTIGPWQFKVKGRKTLVTLYAQTCIDPVTCLMDFIRLPKNDAAHAAEAFQNCWLARYPRPVRCVHDNGPEFRGSEFEFLLMDAGIENVPNLSQNPQSNGIIESVHKTIGQVIRTMYNERILNNVKEAEKLIDNALATAMHATRCAAHSSLGWISPGALTFRRDMMMNIPLLADVITLREKRQAQVDTRLIKANNERIAYDFKVGESVMVREKHGPGDKMKPYAQGPYPILRIHTNGSVTVQKGHIHERVNIRRIKPYKIP